MTPLLSKHRAPDRDVDAHDLGLAGAPVGAPDGRYVGVVAADADTQVLQLNLSAMRGVGLEKQAAYPG